MPLRRLESMRVCMRPDPPRRHARSHTLIGVGGGTLRMPAATECAAGVTGVAPPFASARFATSKSTSISSGGDQSVEMDDNGQLRAAYGIHPRLRVSARGAEADLRLGFIARVRLVVDCAPAQCPKEPCRSG